MVDPTPEQRKQLRQRGAAAVMWLIGGMMEDERMSKKTYKGYTLEAYQQYSYVYGGRATKDGHPDIISVGCQSEKMVFEELERDIDRAESGRVPGLGAFRDWSGVNIERRK